MAEAGNKSSNKNQKKSRTKVPKIFLGPAGTGPDALKGLSFVAEQGLRACEIEFTYGVRMSAETAEKIRALNKKLKLRLSIHAPYYINLASHDPEKIIASKKRIVASCRLGSIMGASYVVFHAGFYGKHSHDECYDIIKSQIISLKEELEENNINIALAPETTGKKSQFGSLEELLRLRKETGCSICVDFAHLYARENGRLKFSDAFKAIDKAGLKKIHAHFSGIEFTEKGERRHLILEESFFRPLAKEILKRDIDITIISESPVTWQDSLKMKSLLESLGYAFG